MFLLLLKIKSNILIGREFPLIKIESSGILSRIVFFVLISLILEMFLSIIFLALSLIFIYVFFQSLLIALKSCFCNWVTKDDMEIFRCSYIEENPVDIFPEFSIKI